MNEKTRQRVLDADDADLRRLTHEHLKVFAKFTSPDCPICEELAPPFAKFADDAGYEGMLFIRLSANENPVALHMMKTRVAPFFVSYCQGRLLECDTRITEAEVKDQLERLRHFMPQP